MQAWLGFCSGFHVYSSTSGTYPEQPLLALTLGAPGFNSMGFGVRKTPMKVPMCLLFSICSLLITLSTCLLSVSVSQDSVPAAFCSQATPSPGDSLTAPTSVTSGHPQSPDPQLHPGLSPELPWTAPPCPEAPPAQHVPSDLHTCPQGCSRPSVPD